MIEPSDRVLVAVSGGIDSVVLLRVLHHMSEQLGIELVVAHLDHQMRDNSELDADFVGQLASDLNIQCVIERTDVPAYIESSGRSPEDAARLLRYQFLGRVADTEECGKIALGHQLDDRVETFLLNLLRGSGVQGLSGMPPVRTNDGITFIRPLFDCARSAIESHAKANNWQYSEDPTNENINYTRNRIRHELIPLMREFNPNLNETIARTTDRMSKLNSMAGDLARKTYETLLISQSEGVVTLNRPVLIKLKPALAESVLREAIRHVQGDLKNIDSAHTERALFEIAKPTSGLEVPIANGLKITVDAEHILIHAENLNEPHQSEFSYELDLKRRSQQAFEQIGWGFETQISDDTETMPNESLEAAFDFDKIVGSLIVRNRRPGDRFRPLGLGGTKKIQDLLVDAKIPERDRDRIPLVCDEEGILWVAGIRVSERCRVTPQTKRVLKIRAFRTLEE